jgi:hypothetical protein
MPSEHDEGIAILFSVEVDGSEANWDVFCESESECDPALRAERLRDSSEGDFPTRMWGIALNDRARELMSERRMRQWGIV